MDAICCVYDFKVSYVSGRHHLMLFSSHHTIDKQQCKLHKACRKTICIGDVACIEQELQHYDKNALRACQIQNCMKVCIFSTVKSALIIFCILSVQTTRGEVRPPIRKPTTFFRPK